MKSRRMSCKIFVLVLLFYLIEGHQKVNFPRFPVIGKILSTTTGGADIQASIRPRPHHRPPVTAQQSASASYPPRPATGNSSSSGAVPGPPTGGSQTLVNPGEVVGQVQSSGGGSSSSLPGPISVNVPGVVIPGANSVPSIPVVPPPQGVPPVPFRPAPIWVQL